MCIKIVNPVTKDVYLFWDEVNVGTLPNIYCTQDGVSIAFPGRTGRKENLSTTDMDKVLTVYRKIYPDRILLPFSMFTVLSPLEIIGEIEPNTIVLSDGTLIQSNHTISMRKICQVLHPTAKYQGIPQYAIESFQSRASQL